MYMQIESKHGLKNNVNTSKKSAEETGVNIDLPRLRLGELLPSKIQQNILIQQKIIFKRGDKNTRIVHIHEHIQSKRKSKVFISLCSCKQPQVSGDVEAVAKSRRNEQKTGVTYIPPKLVRIKEEV